MNSKLILGVVAIAAILASVIFVAQNIRDIGDSQETFAFEGYHTLVDVDDHGSLTTCNALVITGGSQVDQDYYLTLVGDDGSTFGYSVNEEGLLVLNLDLEQLKALDPHRISDSTVEEPVTLTLKRKPETATGQGAPACYSFVEILDVK